MEMDKVLAQKVVARLHREIPYNINVMNQQGTIIASGEPSRVGQSHPGAIEAIQGQKTNIIEQDQPDGTLRGFNMPIVVQNEVIGVVGITGAPEKLTYIAPLVKVTTELLTEQALADQVLSRAKRRLERFLFDWLAIQDPAALTPDFVQEANALGVNIDEQYQAMVIKTPHLLPETVEVGSYKLRITPDELLILTRQAEVLAHWHQNAKEVQAAVGISQPQKLVSEALKQAREVIKYNQGTNQKLLYYTAEVDYAYRLLSADIVVDEYVEKFRVLAQTDSGQVLITTFQKYFRNNGNIVETAHQLHIHRNTLNYRLGQIKDKLGLDPKRYDELVILYTAFLNYELQ